jgi:preprotein translocase subunit YajC
VNPSSLLLLVLMAAVLFLLFSRSRRQQRSAQQLQAGLAPGTKIMTTAGLYATVVDIDGQVVTLETAPGRHSRWDRRAIARVLPQESLPEHGVDDDEDDEDPDDDRQDGGDAAGTAPTSQETAPPDRA